MLEYLATLTSFWLSISTSINYGCLMVVWCGSYFVYTGCPLVGQLGGCETFACCLLRPPRGTWFHVELLFGLGPNIIGTMKCLGASPCGRWVNKCHVLTQWGWLWVYCDKNTHRIVISPPQYPLYASQFGLGTLPQHAMASYGVPWGLTVWPVGQKVPLFDSVRVIRGVVWPKYA